MRDSSNARLTAEPGPSDSPPDEPRVQRVNAYLDIEVGDYIERGLDGHVECVVEVLKHDVSCTATLTLAGGQRLYKVKQVFKVLR